MPPGRHPPDADVDHAEVAFHPPVLLLASLILGFAARWIAPATFLPSDWASIGGPIAVAAAMALFVWAVTAMRLSGASIPTGEPTDRLVLKGPYGFSRNPIYLSMVCLMSATAIWTNSLWFLGLAAIMIIVLNWGVISREERYLERKLGAAYTTYKKSVRRWC